MRKFIRKRYAKTHPEFRHLRPTDTNVSRPHTDNKWAFLETAEFSQNLEVLEIKTHPVSSKILSELIWFILWLWFIMSIYGLIAFNMGDKISWSPQYGEAQQWKALQALNSALFSNGHASLMLNHTYVDRDAIEGFGGNSWWWLVLNDRCTIEETSYSCCETFGECIRCRSTSNMVQTGKCFPCCPTGWFDAPRFSSDTIFAKCWCLVCCTGAKVGTARLTHDMRISDIYAELEVQDWERGVSGCGPTRWSSTHTTPSLVFRNLKDGSLQAVFDVHAFICCFHGTHCQVEGKEMMSLVRDRIHSFLNENSNPLEVVFSDDDDDEDDDLYGDVLNETKAMVVADVEIERTDEEWQIIENQPPPSQLSETQLNSWLCENRRESHKEHPNYESWRMLHPEEEEDTIDSTEEKIPPEKIDFTKISPELQWQLLKSLDSYTTDEDLSAYYDTGTGVWNIRQLHKDLTAVQKEVQRQKREAADGNATSGLANRMAQLQREKEDTTGKLKQERLAKERDAAIRKHRDSTANRFTRSKDEKSEKSALSGFF